MDRNKNIPTIPVGINEEKFADAIISEFGGDTITKATLMMGEEAAEIFSIIAEKPGLSKSLKIAVRHWVSNHAAPQSCYDAKALDHEVKIVVNGRDVQAEVTEESFNFFDIHVKLEEAKEKLLEMQIAAQEETEKAVQSALKKIESRKIALEIMKQVYFAMCAVAKMLVREFKQFSHENYKVDIKKAMRVVSEGGARTLSIERKLVFQGKYGIVNMSRSILLDEIKDAKRFVFAKIHNDKVVTASVIDDLRHIKGQLHFATKERSGSLIRSLKKVAKRTMRKVRRTVNTVVSTIKARGHLWARA